MKKTSIGMRNKMPAVDWRDATPCGNGSLGALVHGHIRNECIIVNHERLFLPMKRPILKDTSRHLAEFRRFLSRGQYQEGLEFFSGKLAENVQGETRPAPYQPLMDIKIDAVTAGAFRDYSRTLDFETGEACVSWTDSGTVFHRRLFVSREIDAVVLEISASERKAVSCDIWLAAHASEKSGSMGAGTDSTGFALPFTWNNSAAGGLISFTAKYNSNSSAFGGTGMISTTGGKLSCHEGKAQIRGADKLLLIVKAFVFEEPRPAMERIKRQLKKTPKDYKQLFSEHAANHRKIFNSMTLELDGVTGLNLSNEQLLIDSYDGEVPTELILKLFNYGRYLLISSSRPGGLPANLQGVWNGDYKPAWDSDYHNDINIQMNYWQALPGNMAQATMPYFDYYESMLDDYRENARLIYGCRGAFAPIAQTTHGLLYSSGIWTAWTAGAAWLAQLFHDYYLFTGDRKFLEERAVPFMRDAALFYEDFATEGEDGRLVFSPSLSPENFPLDSGKCLLTVNATMDIAIAKELLTNLCSACRLLDIEHDGVKRWESMLAKLPEYEINDDGAVREWLHPGFNDNYHHRHMSHIYPIFPGIEIYEEKDKRLFRAFEVAIEKRLVVGLTSQTGWSFAKMANVFARLGRGDRALDCIELICRSCLGQNLFTYHNDWRSQGLSMYWGSTTPPFQIDANFGISAAILEMLVFSAPGIIKLLPAIPKKWKKGRAENIQCRGGIAVSVSWDEKSFEAKLVSKTRQGLILKVPSALKGTMHANCIVEKSGLGDEYLQITLHAKKNAKISGEYKIL